MQKTWIRVLTTLATLLCMAMIFALSMEPAEDSDATSGLISIHVARLIRSDFDGMPQPDKQVFFDQVQFVVRKCAHFTEFFLLGFSMRLCLESWLGNRQRLGLFAWLGGTAWAALDELHQVSVAGRVGQPTDVIIDSIGVLCGAALAFWFVCRRFRRQG